MTEPNPPAVASELAEPTTRGGCDLLADHLTEEQNVENTEDPRPSLQDLAERAGQCAASTQNFFVEAIKASSATMQAFRHLIEALAEMDTPSSVHVLFVGERGAWTVHHPLSCRQPNWRALAECQVPQAIAAAEALPGGWHAVDVQHDGECVFAPLPGDDLGAAVTPPACTCEAPYDVPGVGHHPNCDVNQPTASGLTHDEMLEEAAGYHPNTGEPDDPAEVARRRYALPEGDDPQRHS